MWILLVLYAGVCTLMSYSSVAPFLPSLLEEKGLSSSWNAGVFAIYAVGHMFSVIMAQRLCLPKLGRAWTLTLSSVVLPLSMLGLALLKFISNDLLFLSLALLLRLLQGGTTAVILTAGLALLSFHYPQSLELIHNLFLNSCNLGMALGPFIGSFLFKRFEYVGPFITLTILSLPPILIKCAAPH